MPRKPTEKVIEYRITLGTWERERLGMLAGSKTFNNIAEPILDNGVKLISDVSATLTILGLVAGYLGFQFISDGIEDSAEAITSFIEQMSGAEIPQERRGLIVSLLGQVLDPTPGNIFSGF
tara:strand:- start:2645 stop:3007 length:363 start_codon:yes stop_codon:yes gene_type:complete